MFRYLRKSGASLLLMLACSLAMGQATYVPSQITDIANLKNRMQVAASGLFRGKVPCASRCQGVGNATGFGVQAYTTAAAATSLLTASATGTTTTVLCATNTYWPGQQLVSTSGSNSGTTVYIQSVSGSSSPYTYTVGQNPAGLGSASLPVASAMGDTFTVNNTGVTYSWSSKLYCTAHDFQIVLSNPWYHSGDNLGYNNIIVSASMQDPTTGSGQYYQFTFNGAIYNTLQTTQTIVSDPLPLSGVAGNTFNYRVCVQVVTVGQKWAISQTENSITAGTGEGDNHTPGASAYSGDVTTSTVPNNGTATGYNAIAIVGTPGQGVGGAVAICGDSIAIGYCDLAGVTGTINSSYDHGWTEQGNMLTIPHMRLAAGAEQGSALSAGVATSVGASGRWNRFELAGACPYIIDAWGVNDVVAPLSLATMQANAIIRWRYENGHGSLVWANTLTPRTNTTDHGLTLAAQTYQSPGVVSSVTAGTPGTVAITGNPYSSGTQVAIGNVVGPTGANGLFYLSGAGPYTLYSDSGLTQPVTVTGTYTSGGTTSTQEAVRQNYNTWIRAGAPLTISGTTYTAVTSGTTGAVYAGQSGHPLTGYFDPCTALETALNSGFYQIPTSANIVLTGTTTGGSTTTLQDTSQSWATGRYTNYFCSVNGGALRLITATTATQLTLGGSSTVSSGLPYTIYSKFTDDGVHPHVSYGQAAYAGTINTALFK